MTSYYEILELDRNQPTPLTSIQIQKAYRRLALIHHPDKGGDPERFKQISNAYEVLSSPELRQQYEASQPIPETQLSPPLRVFKTSFEHWLKGYPLVNSLFLSSCQDILVFLDKYAHHPLVTPILTHLSTGSVSTDFLSTNLLSTGTWIKAVGQYVTQTWRSPPPLNYKVVTRSVEVTPGDLSQTPLYNYRTTITNQDLKLDPEVRIVNPQIAITIPLSHAETITYHNLQIIAHDHSYVQNLKLVTEIILLYEGSQVQTRSGQTQIT